MRGYTNFICNYLQEKLMNLKLSRFLPYRLSVLTNRVSDLVAAAYSRPYGMSRAQWRVLAVLGEQNDLTATEIAEATAQDKVSVTRAVQALIVAGQAQRRASQDDGRVSHLRLTRKGQKTYADVAPAALACERALLKSLSATERRQLDTLLEKLSARARDLQISN